MDKIIDIEVEGMSCTHCANAVTSALKKVKGVKEATVDLKSKTATVELSADSVEDADLRFAVENIGFDVISIKPRTNR